MGVDFSAMAYAAMRVPVSHFWEQQGTFQGCQRHGQQEEGRYCCHCMEILRELPAFIPAGALVRAAALLKRTPNDLWEEMEDDETRTGARWIRLTYGNERIPHGTVLLGAMVRDSGSHRNTDDVPATCVTVDELAGAVRRVSDLIEKLFGFPADVDIWIVGDVGA